MFQDRLEQNDFIVGNSPFGLVEKNVKFARWDARKAIMHGYESPSYARRLSLFEGVPNNTLLDQMQELYGGIASMESAGLTRSQILERLLAESPDLDDFGLLLRKAPWGARLRQALSTEIYETTEEGLLWSEFVLGRIHRALGGQLSGHTWYNGRMGYKIKTEQDVLDFFPVSNREDVPEIRIYENVEETPDNGIGSDGKFVLRHRDLKKVEIFKAGGKVDFIRTLPGEELHLIYRREPTGSYHQIELESRFTN